MQLSHVCGEAEGTMDWAGHGPATDLRAVRSSCIVFLLPSEMCGGSWYEFTKPNPSKVRWHSEACLQNCEIIDC